MSSGSISSATAAPVGAVKRKKSCREGETESRRESIDGSCKRGCREEA